MPNKQAIRNQYGLSAREEKVAQRYVCHLNWSLATREAGYKPSARRSMWARNHKKINARVRMLQQELGKAWAMEAESLLQEIASQAFLDPGELVDENGRIRPLEDMPPNVRRAIAEYTEETTERGHTKRKVKLHNKVPFVKMLQEYFGDKVKAPEKTEVKHTGQAQVVFVGVQKALDES